ncbi:type VI secretion system membrane subunit TssM [Helicobacter kayseriensis]|uniref:type VI secretion system membrane subunit TssM n=1 Tax=Helicobacter kayseriensis TaxID=2905877 RepID=UPI001E634DC8|nr:type VI secretion system membrane subunit TssM [Helicobacter kayseriensis]MCE3047785.1 type VI secretion system membrane subunit TssM [Helicobacter kayseriensis]MCE3049151.1 type VI secretion system membrane subunit TssM [Helicobacter kayseriensis]
MKKVFGKLFKFLLSKIFLICLFAFILIGFSTLFWLYGPFLSFNDFYPFSQVYPRIITLCLIWLPTLYFFTHKQIKHFFSEKVTRKRKEVGSIKAQASDFFSKTKRNFFIALNDAKKTWKKQIKIKKLPLVMVIGEEGAGKSSFINYAGLEYPISDALGSYRQHHLSTRNFSFYITKKGVLIDTEGSYFSFENFFKPTNTDEIPEDNIEKNKDYLMRKMIWNSFIKFLSKGYFYKKLNGIIYIIDIVRMLNETKEEMQQGIHSLIKRVRECETHLNLKVPVYIVFTKLDLIEGMGEFLKLYSENLSQKTLGITFPTTFSFSQEELNKHFQELSNSIKYALMGKNNLNSSIEGKKQSYLFFKQLDNLFAFAQEFLQKTYRENEKNKSFIRGVYFVSSYQENTPNNFILSSTCHKYSIKSPIAQNQSNITKQSYFVNSLIEDVIFKDIGLSQNIFGSFFKKISAFFWAIIAIGATAYISNYLITQKDEQQKKLINSTLQVETAIDDLQIRYPEASIERKSFYVQNLKNILAFYPQIFGQTSWTDYPTLKLAYQALNPAKELFLEKSQDLLSLTLIPELEKILLESNNPDELLRALYFYKTIIQHTYLARELISSWVKDNWQLFQKYKIPQEVFIGYIQDLGQTPHKQIQENRAAIKRAQKLLATITKSQRLYTLLSLKANDSQGVYDIKTEVGGSFDEVFDTTINSYIVPKSYTKNGAINLMSNINKYIDETIEIEYWLLENDEQKSNDNKEKITLSMDIIKLYAQEYAQRWQEILSKVKPKPFTNENSGLGILSILGKNNNPIKSLTEVVSKNTQLLEGNDLINQAINIGLPIADFKSIFEALSDSFGLYHLVAKQDSLFSQGLSAVNERVKGGNETTQGDLNTLTQNISKNEKIMKKISEDVANIYKKIINFNAGTLSSQEKIFYALKKPNNPDDPFVILETDSKSLPAEIGEYYNTLSAYAWTLVEERGTKELDIVWNKELYTPFIDQIASTYPINPRSRTFLKIDTFKGFFGKQGVWDKFYSQYLSQILIKKGDTYQVDPAYAKKLNFSDEFLSALTKISTISNGVLDFNNNIDVKFSIKVIALSGDYGKLIISYNDKQIQYDHTLTSNIEFVADAFLENTKLLINAFDYNGNQKQSIEFSGQWAWMQLLQYAKLQGNRYKVIFNKNPKLYFDFVISNGGSTLNRAMEVLPYLNLPQNILK